MDETDETASKSQGNCKIKNNAVKNSVLPLVGSVENDDGASTGNDLSVSAGEKADIAKSSSSTSVHADVSKKSIKDKPQNISVAGDDKNKGVDDERDVASISTTTTNSTSIRKWGGNRNERRNKKMMRKLGMKQVLGITRATFKTTRQGIFYIESPDVYRARVGHRSMVIFGQTYRQDPEDDASKAAALNLKSVEKAVEGIDISNITALEKHLEDKGDMCEDGLKQDDIELVVSQASCSRSEAIVSLRENNGDLVNAIMALTT